MPLYSYAGGVIIVLSGHGNNRSASSTIFTDKRVAKCMKSSRVQFTSRMTVCTPCDKVIGHSQNRECLHYNKNFQCTHDELSGLLQHSYCKRQDLVAFGVSLLCRGVGQDFAMAEGTIRELPSDMRDNQVYSNSIRSPWYNLSPTSHQPETLRITNSF